jgi:hypothetical protein
MTPLVLADIRANETDIRRTDKIGKDIRRATPKHHLVEKKISVVPEGLHGEYGIAALYRRKALPRTRAKADRSSFLRAGRLG